MAINGTGVMLCMSAEAKVMLEQPRKLTNAYWKDERRAQRGSIVNFASVCGFVAMPNVSQIAGEGPQDDVFADILPGDVVQCI
jgi:short-subunit dehydrogenase